MKRIKEKHLRYRKHNYVVLLNMDEKTKLFSVLVNDLDDNCKVVENYNDLDSEDANFYFDKWVKEYTKKKKKRGKECLI